VDSGATGDAAAPSDVLASVGVGVLVVDAGVVSYANAAAGQLLDADPGELEGAPLPALTPADVAPLDRVADAAREPGGTVELPFATADGDPTPASVSTRPLDADDAERYVLTLHGRAEEAPDDERGGADERAAGDDHAGPDLDGGDGAALYEKLFAHSNDAIVVFDPGRDEIVDCNPRACELLGYDREELLSVPPTEIHPEEVERFRAFVADVVDDGAGWTNQLDCYTKEGTTVPAEISGATVELDGRTHVLASVRDLSERRERERALADLQEVTRELMEAETVDAITARAVRAAGGIVGLPFSYVYCPDDAGERLEPAAASPESRRGVGELPSFERGEGVLWAAFESGELAVYEDVQAETAPDADLPFRSAVVVPLGDHGVFGVGSAEPGQFESFDVDTAAVLAAQTEAALDRAAREGELRERSAAMDAALDGIAVLDDGEIVYANRAYASVHGYDAPEDVVGRSWRAVHPDDQHQRFEWDILPAVRSDGDWQGRTVGERADGSTFPESLSLSRIGEAGDRVVAVVRDVTDRRERLHRMEALAEASGDLMTEKTVEGVARAGVSTAETVFGFEYLCVRLYADDADELVRVALSDAAEAAIERRRAYDFEATLAGRAFRHGETVVDEPADDPYADEGTDASLHVPLGEYGVLSVVREDGGFEEETVRRVELLAGTLRSGLARAEREASLRATRGELETRRNELETLAEVDGLLQGIIGELLEAGTPAAVERTVCERLAASRFVRTAWVADAPGEGVDVTPETGAGADWDDDAGELTRPRVAAGLVADTADTGDVGVSDAVEYGPAAVAAVPLVHGGRTFGVLVVDAADADAFGEAVEPGLAVFGETVGFAIQAARSRELLLSDTAVELEFEMEETFGETAAAFDCSLVHEAGSLLADGGVRHYVRVEDGPPDDVAERLGESDRIRECEVLERHGDGGRLEVLVERSPLELLAEFGANLRSVHAEDGVSTVVVETATSTDVRRLVERLTRMDETAELVAKREVDRAYRTRSRFADATETALTDRQLSVLETAYREGYYDWPRERTAEEVAESLDISSSTLHQHLRRAEAKLLAALFDEQT